MNHLIDRELDLSGFDVRYHNDVTGGSLPTQPAAEDRARRVRAWCGESARSERCIVGGPRDDYAPTMIVWMITIGAPAVELVMMVLRSAGRFARAATTTLAATRLRPRVFSIAAFARP
jgi:hypothetical protein